MERFEEIEKIPFNIKSFMETFFIFKKENYQEEDEEYFFDKTNEQEIRKIYNCRFAKQCLLFFRGNIYIWYLEE